MAGGLKIGHGKFIFLRDLFYLSLLFFSCSDFVLNLVQLESKCLFPYSFIGLGSVVAPRQNRLLCGVVTMTYLLPNLLLDLKLHVCNINSTISVVYDEFSFGDFERSKHVLVE